MSEDGAASRQIPPRPAEVAGYPELVNAPPPTPTRYRPPTVQALGRAWPRATRFEQVAWGAHLIAVIGVLITAWVLDADPSGVGTHQQLGLPECGFIPLFGGPCPSCGFTTTFALAADGHVIAAFVNQPFGFLMFLAAVSSVPLAAIAVSKRVSWLEATDRWHWGKIVAGTIALWLLCWGYKWAIFPG